jgi:ketosteroid isomerase-like protein
MNQSKTQTIQAVYGAFGRGDIASIVEAFTPQGDISFNVARPAAPWQKPVKGHAQLPAFFAAIGENIEFSMFEPMDLIESADAVVARVRMKYRVKSTAQLVEQTQVHWWSFDGPRIRSLVHFEDTAQVAAAMAKAQ